MKPIFARVESIQGFKLPKAEYLFLMNILFLSSSPDGIFSSPAFGYGTIEIKCPFNWRFITVKQGIEYLNPPLRFDEENNEYHMNKGHDYYYQVQLQMYTTGYRFASFVVYTTIDLVYIEVAYDNCLMEKLAIPRSTEYFQTGYCYKNSFYKNSFTVLHLFYIQTNVFLGLFFLIAQQET